MNAKQLATKWVNLKKISNANWGKLCGIFQNLLKRYNSEEIREAIDKYIFYYPYSKIEGFVGYCGRIIKNERTKKRSKRK